MPAPKPLGSTEAVGAGGFASDGLGAADFATLAAGCRFAGTLSCVCSSGSGWSDSSSKPKVDASESQWLFAGWASAFGFCWAAAALAGGFLLIFFLAFPGLSCFVAGWVAGALQPISRSISLAASAPESV